MSDANNINYNGFFNLSAEGIHGPVANQVSELIHCQYNQNTGRQIGWRAGRPDEPLRHRTKMNGEWQGWIKLYDSNNPPQPMKSMPFQRQRVALTRKKLRSRKA
ncbi:hypothetical protein ABFY58_26965 [Enterobacter soli]